MKKQRTKKKKNPTNQKHDISPTVKGGKQDTPVTEDI